MVPASGLGPELRFSQGGSDSVALRRGLLQRVLREEAERRSVKVEFGKRLDTYQVGSGGRVVARFTDGSEPRVTC